MADNYDYLDLVGPQGQDQLKTLLSDMRTLVSEIVNANKAAKGFEFNAQGAKSLKDITTSSNQLVDANGKLVAAQATLNGKYKEATTLISQFNGQSKEVVQVQQEVIKLKSLEEKAARAAAKANEQTTSAYKALNDQYRKAANAAKELAAIHGVESEQAKKAAAEVLKLSDNLKKIDASVGQNQRNVGNYKSAFDGLGFSIRNIAGELPNLGISIRTFTQSISNNIGPLTDALKQARAQNALLQAEGKPTVSIGKQIASSIFSWQTAILAAVAAITYLVSVMGKSNSATSSAEKATEKYKRTLESIQETERDSANEEIARMNLMVKIASSTEQSTRARTRAVKELQETYPATFGALTQQAILEGKLGDAVNTTTQALLNRAAAQAAEKEFAAASEKVYKLTKAQQQATIDLLVAQTKLNTAMGKDSEERGLNQFFNQAKYTDAKKALDAITDSLKAAQQEQKTFADDVLKSGQAAGDVLFGNDGKAPKPKKTPRAKDLTNELVKQQEDYTEELYRQLILREQNEADAQKRIADNEKEDLEKRIDAYNLYTLARLQAAGYEAAKEQEITRQKLDKIAEIERKPAGKRTSEENSLVRQKVTLNLALENSELAHRGKIADITADAYAFEDKQRLAAHTKELEDEEKHQKRLQELAEGVGTKGAYDRLANAEKKRQATNERYVQEGVQFAQTLANANSSIANARLEEIDNEINAINKKRDAEIAAIEASGLSAQQKEEKIAAIKGEAAAKTKKLEEDALQRRRRAAIFEKGVTIAQIVATTALAVVKALAEGDYITKVVRVGLAAATGAAQLAAAIAAPIPQYAKGTQNAPEGLAIVGEKGPELQINPDGSAAMTPGVPTLTYLQQGTKIIPAHEVLEMSKMYGMGLPIARQQSGFDTKGIEKGLREVKEAIKSKKETEQIFTWMGILNQARIGQSTVRRIHNQKH